MEVHMTVLMGLDFRGRYRLVWVSPYDTIARCVGGGWGGGGRREANQRIRIVTLVVQAAQSASNLYQVYTAYSNSETQRVGTSPFGKLHS